MKTAQVNQSVDPLAAQHPPRALVVFLENVGHIHGLKLPQWVMNTIDYVTEEYAKIILRLYGAHRRYSEVIILEDEQATGPALAGALKAASRHYLVDVLLLVHGQEGSLIGCKGKECVGKETFGPLLDEYRQDKGLLNLGVVYGVNCYGASLAPVWTALGARAVNGAIGVNWMPEPSLTVFLRNWLGGQPYSTAVQRSNLAANGFWRHIWPPAESGRDHPFIESSRQIVYGRQDSTIYDF